MATPIIQSRATESRKCLVATNQQFSRDTIRNFVVVVYPKSVFQKKAKLKEKFMNTIIAIFSSSSNV